MNKEIIEMLKDEFKSVYCDTCISEYAEEDSEHYYCDDCNRKMMNWRISDHAAERIATRIKNLS